MGIEEVAGELYGLAPEEFTSARNAHAKTAKESGDPGLATAIRGLRKPTAGAWLLNQLVRHHREEVEQVLDLGVRLRAAQGTLGAAERRDLDEQRRALTRAVAGRATAVGRDAGRTVSAQVAATVEETLRSAMVDPGGGQALASGLLVDTFSASGLDPVDLGRVMALGGSGPAVRASSPAGRGAGDDERDERAVEAARRAADDAQEALGSAREASREARDHAAAARRRAEDLRSEVQDVRRRLVDLEAQLTAASSVEDDARRAQHAATREERSATEAAARARTELEALTHRDS